MQGSVGRKVHNPVTDGGTDAQIFKFSDQPEGVNSIECRAKVDKQHPL